jgi:hypothetical protein
MGFSYNSFLSVFRVRGSGFDGRLDLDQDPGGLEKAKMKENTQAKDR